MGVLECWVFNASILQYSITPPVQFGVRWGGAIERNRRLEDFFSLLNSLAHSSLRSLDRCAVPFEGRLDFPGQGRFAQCHIANELFFGNDLHARVILFLVAERRDGHPIVVTGKDANLISEGFEFRQTVILPLGVPSRQIGPAAATD